MKNIKKNNRGKHTPVQGKGVMRSSSEAVKNGVEPQGWWDVIKAGANIATSLI